MESALERELRAARRDRARDETTTISSGALRPGVGAPSNTSSSAPGGTAHYTTQGGSFFEIPHSQQQEARAAGTALDLTEIFEKPSSQCVSQLLPTSSAPHSTAAAAAAAPATPSLALALAPADPSLDAAGLAEPRWTASFPEELDATVKEVQKFGGETSSLADSGGREQFPHSLPQPSTHAPATVAGDSSGPPTPRGKSVELSTSFPSGSLLEPLEKRFHSLALALGKAFGGEVEPRFPILLLSLGYTEGQAFKLILALSRSTAGEEARRQQLSQQVIADFGAEVAVDFAIAQRKAAEMEVSSLLELLENIEAKYLTQYRMQKFVSTPLAANTLPRVVDYSEYNMTERNAGLPLRPDLPPPSSIESAMRGSPVKLPDKRERVQM